MSENRTGQVRRSKSVRINLAGQDEVSDIHSVAKKLIELREARAERETELKQISALESVEESKMMILLQSENIKTHQEGVFKFTEVSTHTLQIEDSVKLEAYLKANMPEAIVKKVSYDKPLILEAITDEAARIPGVKVVDSSHLRVSVS